MHLYLQLTSFTAINMYFVTSVFVFLIWVKFRSRNPVSSQLYYIVFDCIVLYCIALHCIALHCIALHCIALHCIALHCIALHCIALHCIALHCIALHCIGLDWIVLYCIVLYCIVCLYRTILVILNQVHVKLSWPKG